MPLMPYKPTNPYYEKAGERCYVGHAQDLVIQGQHIF